MGNLAPFVLGISGTTLTADEVALFRERTPFGIILFARNIENPDQLARLIDQIYTVTNAQTLLFVDQEGGPVQRLKPPYWNLYPKPNSFKSLTGVMLYESAYQYYRLIGDDLAKMRFDVDIAPCLDLTHPKTASFLLERSFGDTPQTVITAGVAAVKALYDSGISAVIKHIPGHGRALLDSHFHLPMVYFGHDPYEILPEDVQIFRAVKDSEMAMTAHIVYPEIDAEKPMTLSRRGIHYIRTVIGFQGVLISDDISMRAMRGTLSETARESFDAGVEIICQCNGEFNEIKELMEIDQRLGKRAQKQHIREMNRRKERVACILDDDSRADMMSLIRQL